MIRVTLVSEPLTDYGIKKKVKVRTSRDTFNFVKEYVEKSDVRDFRIYETMLILFLDRGNNIYAVHELSSGSTNGTVIDAKLIFKTALLIPGGNVESIILVHNHPSGNTRPSIQDDKITKRIYKAGKIIDIKLIDHLVVAGDFSGYFSYADRGVLSL